MMMLMDRDDGIEMLEDAPTVPEHREQKGSCSLEIPSVSNATIQLDGNFSLMGKNPAELQTYGDVCFSLMGTRVQYVIEEPRRQLQAYGSTHIHVCVGP